MTLSAPSGTDALLNAPMPRRALIGGAALGLAGLALPGCAVSGASGAASASPARACLPPVKPLRDRIIRELVGLRPYRDGGFVVRADRIGEQRIVHNYGHGGAGISLSWGSSTLAAELGLKGHQGPVAVLGAGVMGLTTARLVQEAGFPVTLYAEALPPHTTSNIAGGQWLPVSYFSPSAVTPEWRVQSERAAETSYRRFQLLVGEDYGIRWITNYFETTAEGAQRTGGTGTQPDWRVMAPHEHPFPFDHLRRHQLMLVEPNRFLRQLMRDIQLAGGRFVVRSFASPAQVAALPERLVFNCTGLGSRALFGDTDLRPVRGQLVILLPQPEVDYALGFHSGGGGYMFPRSDGIVLGGTFEEDVWSTEVDPSTTDRILAAHARVFQAMRCAGTPGQSSLS